MTPRPTGRYRFTNPCRWCRGTGCVPASLNGWYVDYHYQDGHDQRGPYSEEEAVRLVSGHSDPTSVATLIGPDGQEYTPEAP